MAIFIGTDGADRILRDSLSDGVISDPESTGTLTGEPNEIHGASGDDILEAGDGYGEFWYYGDLVYGWAGNDLLTGGLGVDTLYGGSGNDTINGGNQTGDADYIFGGSGNDLIHAADNWYNNLDGGTGIDTIYGGTQNDYYTVDDEHDLIIEATNDGFESISSSAARYLLPTNVEELVFSIGANVSGTGNDLDNSIGSNGGNDTLSGGRGNDGLYSSDGSDQLFGGSGDDWLVGGFGTDTLSGGSGNDRLYGDQGADKLVGGRGDDTFVFYNLSDSPAAQRDTISAANDATAFQGAGTAGGDVIDLVNIDGDITTPDYQPLIFGGTGTGHLSLVDSGTNTLVRANVDDDASFEFQILIKDGSVHASAYTADDFLLG